MAKSQESILITCDIRGFTFTSIILIFRFKHDGSKQKNKFDLFHTKTLQNSNFHVLQECLAARSSTDRLHMSWVFKIWGGHPDWMTKSYPFSLGTGTYIGKTNKEARINTKVNQSAAPQYSICGEVFIFFNSDVNALWQLNPRKWLHWEHNCEITAWLKVLGVCHWAVAVFLPVIYEHVLPA